MRGVMVRQCEGACEGARVRGSDGGFEGANQSLLKVTALSSPPADSRTLALSHALSHLRTIRTLAPLWP